MSNNLLRARREAVESPSKPGTPMSRAELAAAVNAHVWETERRRILLDHNAIGRYERGDSRWPGADYRAGLRAVLGAKTDAELGFFRTPRGDTVRVKASVGSTYLDGVSGEEETDPVERRDFLRVMTIAGVGGSLDGLTRDLKMLAPSRVVSEADIARLGSTADFFQTWASKHGGETLTQAVSAEMSRAVDLLKANCPARLKTGLLSAVGRLGAVSGSLLFDGHQHALSDRILGFAATCAEEADDWHLRAFTLSWRTRQAVWIGNLDDAVTYAQLGLVRDDRLTATEQAWLHIAAARAYGRLGDTSATLKAVGKADDAFANVDPANDVPWMAFHDKPQHLGDTGHALFELAVNSDVKVDEATKRLSLAIAGHSDSYVRSRAFSGFKLASLTMHTGDPQHAVQIARTALDDARGIRSQRLRRTALEIDGLATPHQTNDEVSEILRAVRTVSAPA